MQVGTGKSILNGIAIGKLKIYKKKDTVISTAQVADTAAEEARFEGARAKAIDQQTALYEKALAEAGEDIAEVFNIHAMMLDDDDFVDAIKEIINGQHMCAEYAVKKAGDNQAAVFAAMDDPYLQARSADVIDIAQAMLDILQGVDNATLQGTEPSILVAEDLAPSETVRMDKSLLFTENIYRNRGALMDKIKEIGIKPLAIVVAVLALLAGVLGIANVGVGAIICGVLAAVAAVLIMLAFGDSNQQMTVYTIHNIEGIFYVDDEATAPPQPETKALPDSVKKDSVK